MRRASRPHGHRPPRPGRLFIAPDRPDGAGATAPAGGRAGPHPRAGGSAGTVAIGVPVASADQSRAARVARPHPDRVAPAWKRVAPRPTRRSRRRGPPGAAGELPSGVPGSEPSLRSGWPGRGGATPRQQKDRSWSWGQPPPGTRHQRRAFAVTPATPSTHTTNVSPSGGAPDGWHRWSPALAATGGNAVSSIERGPPRFSCRPRVRVPISGGQCLRAVFRDDRSGPSRPVSRDG